MRALRLLLPLLAAGTAAPAFAIVSRPTTVSGHSRPIPAPPTITAQAPGEAQEGAVGEIRSEDAPPAAAESEGAARQTSWRNSLRNADPGARAGEKVAERSAALVAARGRLGSSFDPCFRLRIRNRGPSATALA
jgi:hypothetical protein